MVPLIERRVRKPAFDKPGHRDQQSRNNRHEARQDLDIAIEFGHFVIQDRSKQPHVGDQVEYQVDRENFREGPRQRQNGSLLTVNHAGRAETRFLRAE